MMALRRSRCRMAGGRGQQGAVLLLVLILLTVFLLAVSALVGSSVTNLAGVGNYVFHEGAVATSDSVVADAKAFLSTTPDLGQAVGGRYSPKILTDSKVTGVPDSPCANATDWSCVSADTTTYQGYVVQYFIERLCTSAGTVTAVTAPALCQTTTVTPVSYDMRHRDLAVDSVAVLYRVTVRTTGPRNTLVLTQTVISKGV